MLLACQINYLYFNANTQKGNHGSTPQFLCFILLYNMTNRSLYFQMYNDEIMFMYVLGAIYFTLKDRPYVASALVTLALSVKAGVILILPSFLGCLQYNYGTKTLMKCLAIIVAF